MTPRHHPALVILFCLLLALTAECKKEEEEPLFDAISDLRRDSDDEEPEPCKDHQCPWPYSCVVEDDEKKCVCLEECPNKIELICSTKRRQFLSECELRRAACRNKQEFIKPYYRGGCNKVDKYLFWKKDCKDKCAPDKEIQVCGTDGKTYSHPCKLVRAICKDQFGTLALAQEGQCKDE